MARMISFARFTGGGENIEPGHWSFRPLPPREPESNPNPPHVLISSDGRPHPASCRCGGGAYCVVRALIAERSR